MIFLFFFFLRQMCNKQVTAAVALPPCSTPPEEVALSDGQTVFFTSPNYPETYPNNQQCGWIITSEDPNNQLHLNCPAFKLQRKSNSQCMDYLSVNGDKFCGRRKPSVAAPELQLQFVSNRRRARDGFNCTVSAFSSSARNEGQDCSEMIQPIAIGVGDAITFTSPNFPGNYPQIRQCWQFTKATADIQLTLSCTDFQLRGPNKRDKCRDSLIIKGHGKYCGTEGPNILSSRETLLVKFVAKRTGRDPGFSCVVGAEVATGTEPPLPTFSLIVSPPTPTVELPPAPACGQKYEADTRIVGGVVAEQNEYPWQTGLVKKAFPRDVFCGGSIIAMKWILTAAHCAESIENRESEHMVLVGAHDLRSQAPSQRLLDIKRAIVHPEYDYETVDNDIALLEVDPIYFSDEVGPVCLPGAGEGFVGRMATVTGWGTLSAGGDTSDVLMEVVVPTISQSQCKDIYNGMLTTNMFCAGVPAGGKDSCQGDSGGPLVTPREDDPRRFEQIGIVSWGIGCAEPGHPGVYTNVAKYATWIQAMMQIL
ncbi:suppressor of tumorigenicity 14 protein homolog [Penaeus japonicus]|uniref:suppressor of tumorigenicity 14 protein homolog n=1 Tax=Penaeus japonicus TaxID=27405 RepID=UPI001C710A41|nr:suppressor of tumorigenicity 14 protein homolog [Penaeus japonicus]